MPNIKISQMSVATSLNAADTFLVVQSGTNKKVDLTTILKNLNSTDHIRVNSLQLAVDFKVATLNDANALFVDGSVDRIGVGTDAPEAKFHVNGNLQVGSLTQDGIITQSSENITYTAADQTNVTTKAISPLRAMTSIHCDAGVNGLFSLSNGFNSEIKTIFQNVLDVGKTSTITCTGLGFNTISFNAVGDSAMLQFNSSISKWVIVGGNSATFSTV